MFCLTYELFDQYDSSILSSYQFVDQGILYLLIILCTFHHNQSLNHTVMISCTWTSITVEW